MEQEKTPIVAISHGDINGIGYEVILKTLSDIRLLELCTPVLYGSSKILSYYRKNLDLTLPNINIISSADKALPMRLNVVNCVDEDIKVEEGQSTPQAGKAAFTALKLAAEEVKNGLADVLVTAPINKQNIQSDEFHFPGHTEYLEQVWGVEGKQSLMILMTESLRVALVTGHLPLSEVAQKLTTETILEKLKIFSQSICQDFSICRPRIALLSLNPHAGDHGLLGKEEETIIAPAIKQAEEGGILCFGPYSADGFFGSGHYQKFDGILAMYHDQGLIPFKTIAMEEGVNYTAGLPFVRTSPAHGTAYDIAGKNQASEESFRKAIYMAIDIFRSREIYKQITKNPLKKEFFEKGGDNVILDLTSDD